jgi:hypothetical protein
MHSPLVLDEEFAEFQGRCKSVDVINLLHETALQVVNMVQVLIVRFPLSI